MFLHLPTLPLLITRPLNCAAVDTRTGFSWMFMFVSRVDTTEDVSRVETWSDVSFGRAILAATRSVGPKGLGEPLSPREQPAEER